MHCKHVVPSNPCCFILVPLPRAVYTVSFKTAAHLPSALVTFRLVDFRHIWKNVEVVFCSYFYFLVKSNLQEALNKMQNNQLKESCYYVQSSKYTYLFLAFGLCFYLQVKLELTKLFKRIKE